MTAIGIDYSGAYSRARQLTLADKLRARGIPILDLALVGRHKAWTQENERDLPVVGTIVTIIDRILWIPRLYCIPRAIEWATGRQLGALHFVLSLVLAMTALFGPLADHAWSWLLLVPFLAGIPSALGIGLTYVFFDGVEREMGSWRHTRAGKKTVTVGHFELVEVPMPPDRLTARVNAAKSIPGIDVLVEYRGSDPFVIAVNRFAPWERAYIGAYYTGDPELDRF